ncbi:MAG TPA: DUF2490 domain-containing protein [Gemmatimonadaceae bacterium]|jgi:hypothetical protein|nr:DUF2490 domain-containing protein [Gemmatimonadaceae bacterium]
MVRTLVLAGLLLPMAARAQHATAEWWPEVDVYWTPAEHQRTFLELSQSTEREGSKNEGTVGLYQDYLRLPRGYLRAGYRFTFSMRDASYRESRGVAEATLRVFGTSSWRLVNRSRTELRWVNGEYSYRLRDRLHLQHMPFSPSRRAWRPYVTAEAYYDSRYDTIARIGARAGTEFHIWRAADCDTYVAQQDNSRGTPRRAEALGVTLKLDY